MALAGASGHVFLVSISIAGTGDQKGCTLSNRVDVIKGHLTRAQHKFPNIRKFKVCGEPLLIAIFDVPDEKMNMFEQVVGSLPTNIGVTITCEVLTNFEMFASRTLKLDKSFTARSTENYIRGLSPLIWCQYTLNFKGASVEVMTEAWKEEAIKFLRRRIHGDPESELYKVVGLQKMHAFVFMETEKWDRYSFIKVPGQKMKDAYEVTTVIKMVTPF